MPRDASGNYTLPVGNPVISGTTIESTWANTTMSDIGQALSDSLSRSGKGPMTAALKLASGTVASPGLTFSAETGTGWYRAGAGDIRFAVSGVDAYRFNSVTGELEVWDSSESEWVQVVDLTTELTTDTGTQTLIDALNDRAVPADVLLVANRLSEIDAAGPSARASARDNIGLVFYGWLVDLTAYTGGLLNIGAQSTLAGGIAFNDDGSKMYMVGRNNDTIFEYVLTANFDLSTASYNSVSLDLSASTGIQGLTFNNDGSKMYVADTTADTIRQFSLSTNFDLSTATDDSTPLDVSGQDLAPSDVWFTPDGLTLFVTGSNSGFLYEYSLSAAFDLSTASYTSNSFNYATEDSTPFASVFNPDGTRLLMLGATESVYQYELGTAYDLSTVAYATETADVFAAGAQGLRFSNDGTKMFIASGTSNQITEYATAAVATR